MQLRVAPTVRGSKPKLAARNCRLPASLGLCLVLGHEVPDAENVANAVPKTASMRQRSNCAMVLPVNGA
jgi:hypothetical protein